MVVNSKKFEANFLARNKSIEKEMSLVGKAIKSSNIFELLGITLDKNLSFKIHIKNFFLKAINKIKALFWIRSFLTLELEQVKVLAEAHLLSNLDICHCFGCSVESLKTTW